jgi:hypothetical protein
MAKEFFVEFPYDKAFGFYGIGLLHILGNTTKTLTAAWRELIDSGMFANFPGFLFAKGAGRQLTNQYRVGPGQGIGLDVGLAKLSDAVMPLPYKDLGPAFTAFIAHVEELGQRVGGTANTTIGEGRADAPVGTTLALIEQATKPIGAVLKRLHSAQSKEFNCSRSGSRTTPRRSGASTASRQVVAEGAVRQGAGRLRPGAGERPEQPDQAAPRGQVGGTSADRGGGARACSIRRRCSSASRTVWRSTIRTNCWPRSCRRNRLPRRRPTHPSLQMRTRRWRATSYAPTPSARRRNSGRQDKREAARVAHPRTGIACRDRAREARGHDRGGRTETGRNRRHRIEKAEQADRHIEANLLSDHLHAEADREHEAGDEREHQRVESEAAREHAVTLEGVKGKNRLAEIKAKPKPKPAAKAKKR